MTGALFVLVVLADDVLLDLCSPTGIMVADAVSEGAETDSVLSLLLSSIGLAVQY